MEDLDEFHRLLDHHEQRRGEGMPTVSTLTGTVPLARRLWGQWAARHARHAVVVTEGTAADWLRAWVHVLVSSRDMYEDAERHLRQRLPEHSEASRQNVRERTPHELGLACERAQLADSGMGADRLCRWLLLRRAHGLPLTADDLVRAQKSWFETSCGAADALGQLLGLLPHATAPVLLVVCETVSGARCAAEVPDSHIELFRTAVRQLCQLVTSVPQLTVAMAVSEMCWNAYLERAPESFVKAVVQEHVIEVRGWTAEQVRQAVAPRAGNAANVLAPVFVELARLGASGELVESLDGALMADSAGRAEWLDEGREQRPSPRSTALLGDERDPWRSAQEAFLFQLLEHSTDLSGRFQINATPGFLFGNQPVEVDLLCPQLKIAVEVDGYYHFSSPDRYRRDRGKDVALQRHGFLVLRFLAEDIVPRMLTVLQSIRDAVQWRESQLSHSAGKDALP